MTDQIPFMSYVVERLKQCGVKYVYGVPGDFNLEALDYIENDPVLEWVGNANELNSAYAADGHARVKGGLAVLITTFGVGELSALCGVAGSLAERLPILHIVGAPSIAMQSSNSLLHHTLNTPTSFTAFSTMSAPISCSQALLNQIAPVTPTTWTEAFDKVLTNVLQQCRPGYVEIPTDAVHHKVSAEGLKNKPPHPHSAPPPEASESAEPVGSIETSALSSTTNDQSPAPASEKVTEHVVEEITERFRHAKKPIVLVDACAGRFGVAGEVRKLVEGSGIRFFETPMGKSLLDEHHPLFGGCYAGANSLDSVREEVESADFVMYVGALKSDFNSGSFSVNIDPKVVIELHSFTTNVGYASYPTTDIRHILPRLVPAFKAASSKRDSQPAEGESFAAKQDSGVVDKLEKGAGAEGKDIKHAWMWPRLGQWFADTDIIITETGTSSFGLTNVPLPSHSTYVAQILWGAIGWSVGATLGCALAAKEDGRNRRTVLFVGDGSLQLTLQEIGTMLRRGVCPYLFVLNNDGYEIERQIHGENAKYNDIQLYDHQLLLPFLAGKKCPTPYESIEIHTPQELDDLLEDPAFNKPDKLRLIEVYMPRGDAPAGLIKQAKLTAEANSKA